MANNNNKIELIQLPKCNITKEEAFERLRDGVSQYLNAEDILVLEKAYNIAVKHHEGQLRKSGEE